MPSERMERACGAVLVVALWIGFGLAMHQLAWLLLKGHADC